MEQENSKMDGPDLSLRAFEKSDLPFLHRWLNDEESFFMIGRCPMSMEEVERKVERQKSSGDLLLVLDNGSPEPVGWVHLSKIEHEHGRAEIGILLAPERRGKGLGKRGMSLMLDMAFYELRLHRVYLTTRSINKRGIALYQKLGFSIEGHLREHAFVHGHYYDTLFMGILANEWAPNNSQ